MMDATMTPGITKQNIDYQQIIDNIPLAVYTVDAEGYITAYNKQAIELWGYEPKLGEARWCGALGAYRLDGSELPFEECPIGLCLSLKKPIEGWELLIKRADGTRRMIAPQPKPLFDADGNLVGAVNVLEDITEKKINEEKLARLAAIVESSDDAIIGKTLSGFVISWNAAAERIFGYTAAEMIGESVSKLVPKDRVTEEPVILERLRRGERVQHFETKRVTKDNRLIDVSITISPIRDRDGQIIGASKIARDISAGKDAERQVREEEARFRMAVEATKLGTWTFSPQSGELHWSDECKNIYDLPAGKEVTYDLFLQLLHPEDAALATDAIRAAMDPAGKGTYDVRFRILRYSDRHVRWIRSQGKVYFDDQKMPIRFIGTVLDITEEKVRKDELERLILQRTEELQRANASLRRSNKELEEFAHVASHDLQEPLRKIMSFADKLGSKLSHIPDPELDRYLQKIFKSADRMSTLIKDILSFATLNDANNNTFVETDLNDILKAVKDDLEAAITRENAIVHADLLPSVVALPLQMQQLFFNLLSNSLKFRSPERTPVIIIASRPLEKAEAAEQGLDTARQYYKISISDNGVGFEMKYSNHIFAAFKRLDHTEDVSGNGIGLGLCKKIIDNHGGLISAKGKENRGATFTVILPAAGHK